MDTALELEFRSQLMDALVQRAGAGDGTLSRSELSSFPLGDRSWRVVDRGRGIRNPLELLATLSIISDPNGSYPDVEVSPGVWKYAYQVGPTEGSNTKLRRAHELGIPVIFLRKLGKNVFLPISLASVIEDNRVNRFFTIALVELEMLRDPTHPTAVERRYAERVVMQRLHQPAFRGIVLRAYASRCAVCTLKHAELLDAAHIIGDGEAHGEAAVNNGLSLCKIHHTAYDRNFLGVSPDHAVHINRALLNEVDGPMLKHGLQEMHGRQIIMPSKRSDRPDRERLAERYAQFIAVG